MTSKIKNNRQTGKFEQQYSCDSCQLVRINGVVCHETGCPDAWKDEIRECEECGSEFKPESRLQYCCDDYCSNAYNGLTPLEWEDSEFYPDYGDDAEENFEEGMRKWGDWRLDMLADSMEEV